MAVEFEQLRERANPWVEPIPGATPGGVSMKLEPPYQNVLNEVAKLDMPSGGAVDWKKVIETCSELLRARTKDLMLTCCLAHALHMTKGLDGLATGVTLLAEMIERYWDTLFPEVKRLRGRANAVQWFLEKTVAVLPAGELKAAEANGVEALETAARQLSRLVRERFDDSAPATGPLLERIERLRLSLAAPPPELEAERPAQSQVGPAPEATQPTVAPPPNALPAPVEELSGAEESSAFLRRIGDALVNAAGVLRRSDSTNPTSYRLLRVGLWLHLSQPPPTADGKTQIAPLPQQERERLLLMAQNLKWAALLEECESLVSQYRLALDLHRMSWQALAGLGASHDSAQESMAIEVRSLLARMPQLPSLSFADGSPLADPQTRSWIAKEVLKQRSAGSERQVPAESDGAAAINRSAEVERLLAANRTGEALALLQEGVVAARGGREQFLARLEMARTCAGAGLTAIAKATYEELAEEAAAKALDTWEPTLIAGCLKELMACAQVLSQNPRSEIPNLEIHFRRLCRLDPAAAHEFGAWLKYPHS